MGCDADLAVVRRESYVYNAATCTNTYANWSPYDNMTIHHQVSVTMVRGQWVYRAGSVLAEPGFGEFVSPTALKKGV